jgi:FkbM family methyltransferase
MSGETGVLQKVKTIARNALPPRHQVPVKYWYGRLRGDVEQEMALLGELLGAGDHVLDIGGNRGTYAYCLWKLGARLDIFEPNPACAHILQHWAAGKAAVKVHAVALSDHGGMAELHVPVDEHGVEHDASASIEAMAGIASRTIEVPLRPLDSFGFIDTKFIKIDVEGHEASVIAGAAATLRASHPALLVEIEQRHNSGPIDAVFRQIEDQGYRGFFLIEGKLRPLAEFDLQRHQSIEAFEGHRGAYQNNFLFLGKDALENGRYRSLMSRMRA